MLHKEWFEYYRDAYFAGLKATGIRSSYPTAKSVAKHFSVDSRTVAQVIKTELWKDAVQVELEERDKRSADLGDYLQAIDNHRKIGLSANNQVGRLFAIQLKTQERIQKIIDHRLSFIEGRLKGDAFPDAAIAMHLGDGDFNDYTKDTVNMVATAGRTVSAAIGALDKTNAIAAEALDIQESVLLTKQMELDFDN